MVEQQDSRHYRQPNPYAAPPPPQQSHRGSPVLGQLDQRPQHSSTPSPTYGYAQLPSMAQQHPPRSMPTSYPVSSSYAPPVMGYPQYPVAHQNSYPIPTSAPQQLGLPSIRSLPPANGVQLGSTLPSLNSPYQFQGHLPSPQNITSQPQMVHPGMRVPYPSGMPLGAANERVMSGGRHKKEIKRRTKTGCLTCRKRRIKVCLYPLQFDPWGCMDSAYSYSAMKDIQPAKTAKRARGSVQATIQSSSRSRGRRPFSQLQPPEWEFLNSKWACSNRLGNILCRRLLHLSHMSLPLATRLLHPVVRLAATAIPIQSTLSTQTWKASHPLYHPQT